MDRWLVAGIMAAAWLGMGPGWAHALEAGAESVENYSGCGCASGNLSYTNNQAKKFIDKIDNWHTRKFWYKDGNAWNSDLVEDELGVGGTDYLYGDQVHILFVSGHGGVSGTGRYYGYLCKSSNFNHCSYNTSQTYLGEQAGQTYATHPGKLRFLILSTCHSVEKDKAPDQWGPVFWRGKNFLYVMGYTGTSADSWTTDEVGEDFARKAAGSGWTLKQAWFWAIEDWWVNDTGAVISRGATQDEAIDHRDHMKLGTAPDGHDPWWVAWAWHSG
ncbi:hypothetical protein G3N55_06410 [Dissulfurirhabdus thermomarina]|uniref:CHAT domain-containing protein n=1 Tax=Dissulfurirhabdus thermomarina TaxID=1765737 RepID=A0A6N9TRU7_DISTH|nr:DUF6345 domain-containing protein [Dissulfurirhabdus thermomarina]NDY42474.1 hypothetical protein [Dissulfurirhabdus thermomarina]